MTIPAFNPTMWLPLLPKVLLLVLAMLVLAIDLIWSKLNRRLLGWVTALGLAAILVVSLLFSQPQASQGLIFGGMLRDDWLGFIFQGLFLFAAMITALISMDVKGLGDRGEYYTLLIVTTLGMTLMGSAADLIMLYLAIETTSIPMYILAGFFKGDQRSTESGLKYFLFGALASTVMLYGFSLLYGLSGQTNLEFIAMHFMVLSSTWWVIPLAVSALLVLVGFAFKISAVPFHFWTPDVYEGAPTPVTAFISTGSKAAGFAVLLRVMLTVFPSIDPYWAAIVASMAAVTMTLGNMLALAQTNIKRLLAYSSIAHAGYAMIGVVALSELGAASVVFYLIAYVLTNMAAFAVVILFARSAGSEEISDYAGLSRRAPGLAMAMLIAFLSLAGMPPLAGFVGKFYVFAAAVQSGMIWIAVVGIINAIIGLYYYMTVLKVVYLYRSEDEDKPISVPGPYKLALAACVALILLVGVLSGPWLNWSIAAAGSLF